MIAAIPDSAAEIRARGGVASLSGDGTDAGNIRDLDPDGIAPFVCYLASDYASNINGQTFLVYGDTISLVSQPRPERAIWTETGHWEMHEISERAPQLPDCRHRQSCAAPTTLTPTPIVIPDFTGIPYPQGNKTMPLLQDKVAIVTGAGRGIGRGVAKLMAQEGASVVVCDLGVNVDGSGADVSVAQQVVNEIKEDGGNAVACTESVATMAGGEKIVQTAVDNFGKLDIVVTVAGILRDRMVFNMSEQEWDDVIAVHLKGTFTVVKHASILFRQQRSGRIITFSSTSGLYGNSGQANYGAAKDGIAGFTRVCARDLGRYGVTANSISPSASTRMTTSVPDEARALRSARGIAAGGGLRGDAEDVAPMVTWLASDEAAHVNGHVFHVTGGLVTLLNEPEPIKSIRKQGRWTVDELAGVFPATIGIELYNPAPAPPPTA